MKKIVVFISIMLLAASCGKSPQFIDADNLRAIVKESIITDAILTESSYAGVDTMDVYSVILKRKGYTLDDFEYTIKKMAERRSSPLSNLFDSISKEISADAAVANYRYKKLARYDSTALAYCTDTLYLKDTLLKGNLSKFKVDISNPRKGDYLTTFDYSTHVSYDVGLRQIRVSFVDNDTSKMALASKEHMAWINRSFTERQFIHKVSLDTDLYDTLRVRFRDPDKLFKGDTSYVKNILITHTPDIATARRRYLYDHTGLAPDSNYIKRYEELASTLVVELPTDSLPTGDTLFGGWRIPQRRP